MTTPTAASAAPVAAGTDPAASAAPAAAAATAAPAAASLLDGAPAAPAAAPAAPAAPAAQSTTVNQDPAPWFYADGTPGTGKAPDWFKADKYKTVDKQAEAYSHLEKRLGAFVGAPESGKYAFKAPEGLNVELDQEHPLLQDLHKWGLTNQLSQDRYNELLGMLAQYEASMIPDIAEMKTAIGENADARIAAVSAWGQANLDAESFNTLKAALSGQKAAESFKVVEALIAKTVQKPMPKPGQDVSAAQPGGEAAIRAKMQAKDDNGKLKFFTDAKYRNDVEAEMRAFYQQQQGAA